MSGSAVISPCGLFRYRLERHGLSGAGAIAWIMVNPSTADATENDATIRRVIGFTERLGGGWAGVGNKFAFRAKDIKALRTASDPAPPVDVGWRYAADRMEAPMTYAEQSSLLQQRYAVHRARWRKTAQEMEPNIRFPDKSGRSVLGDKLKVR